MWIRKFRLELSGEDVDVTFDKFRMDFIYQEFFKVGNLTNMADTFDIEVYNLSVDTYKSLVSDKEVRVKFYTGYADADELDLLFEGIVTNVVGRRVIPEHITTLYCIPSGLALVNKKVSYTGKRTDTVKDVLEGVAGLLGLSVKYEGVDDIVGKPYRSKTVQGIAIHELVDIGEQFYFMPRVENEELRVITLPEKDRINKLTKIHKLKAELIRGVPMASVAKLSIPYALNTYIRTGDVIATTVLEGTASNLTGGIGNPNGLIDVSGLGKGSLHYSDTLHKWAIVDKYQIIAAEHKGSNYTDQFISKYECVAYIGNKKG